MLCIVITCSCARNNRQICIVCVCGNIANNENKNSNNLDKTYKKCALCSRSRSTDETWKGISGFVCQIIEYRSSSAKTGHKCNIHKWSLNHNWRQCIINHCRKHTMLQLEHTTIHGHNCGRILQLCRGKWKITHDFYNNICPLCRHNNERTKPTRHIKNRYRIGRMGLQMVWLVCKYSKVFNV